MKKLLAILLALMMVMVSAFALAAGMDPADDPNTGDENQELDGDNNDDNPVITPSGNSGGSYQPGTGEDKGEDDVGNPRVGSTLANGGSITIGKSYTLQILEGAKVPGNSISFAATLGSVTDSTVTVADMSGKDPTFIYTAPAETAVTGNSYAAGNITIQFPTYPEVGVYTYTVEETGGAYAGVTYSDDITMKVTVIRVENELKIAGIAFRTETEKLGEITNDYEAGTLEVTKTVTGNMGDQNKDFEITVTFTAPEGKKVNSTIGIATSDNAAVTKIDGEASTATSIAPWGDATSKTVTFTLKHTDTITFTNVPAGVGYSVEETSYTSEGYDAADYENQSGTMAHALVSATVTNNKDMTIDTGVTLESGAYMLIMALALAGFVMLKVRRREEY